jgi:hypothetical protein
MAGISPRYRNTNRTHFWLVHEAFVYSITLLKFNEPENSKRKTTWFAVRLFLCFFPSLKSQVIACQYVCTVSIFMIFSPVMPYIAPFGFERKANSGDSVQLTCCIAKGDTPLSISWNLQGKNLTTHVGVVITEIGPCTSLLTIASVAAVHGGEYYS